MRWLAPLRSAAASASPPPVKSSLPPFFSSVSSSSSSSPHRVPYRVPVATLLLFLFAFALTLAAHWLPLAVVTVHTLDGYGESMFTLSLWRLVGGDPLIANGSVVHDDRPAGVRHVIRFRSWERERLMSFTRVCLSAALFLPLVAVGLDVGLLRWFAASSLTSSPPHSPHAVALSTLLLRPSGENVKVKRRGDGEISGDVDREGTGRIGMALHQCTRQMRRILQHPRLALVQFLFQTAEPLLWVTTATLLCLSAADCARYVRGYGMAAELEDVFVLLHIPLSDEDIYRFSDRRLGSGYACILAASLCAFTGVAIALDEQRLGHWFRCGEVHVEGRVVAAARQKQEKEAADISTVLC